MSSPQVSASKLDNSNGSKKHDAPIKPTGPKPQPNQTQAADGDMAASLPKKKADFKTLLKRCIDGASATKASEAENAKTINQTLANIYRLFNRAKADPDAKETSNQALKKAGIKASKNTTTEFAPLVKYIYGKESSRPTVSRCANTLQLALVKKVKSRDFVDFVEKAGGTAKCASLMANERKIAVGISEDTEAAAARKIKALMVLSVDIG